MEKITGQVIIPPAKFKKFQEEIKNILDFKKKLERSFNQKITETLEVLLSGSICLDGSDIHIEPEKEKAKIRVRLDGILHDVLIFELDLYKNLLSRIKLLSGIKLNITDRPQDGRFSILIGSETIEIRASSLPGEYGESLVLRILNPKSLIEIEALGLRKDLFAIFQREIKRPNGMIIVTGPTGSGKTTTLYAFLKKIQRPEVKIITIEDPIEYHLEGISQTQTAAEKGYNFANGLKSIVRQDPDVILVGEIRDLETAEIALQAALTGHLVLSTLHTNDAAGTVSRLVSLGAKSFNIAPGLNMAVAQRLIRKVCKKCSALVPPSLAELKKIKKGLKGIPLKILKQKDNFKIPKIKGCKDCNFTGYRKRVGIFEAFLVDEEMEKFILKSPAAVDLKNLAIKKGMFTMYQDGLLKVLEGVTTIEEVERVAGEE